MASAGRKPPIVIDNGTGYTKLGYAGNSEPSYIVPSSIALPPKSGPGKRPGCFDLDFAIGDEAFEKKATGYTVFNPMAHGLIEDWNMIEKYWQRCLFQYMRCDPEEHFVILTEPPLNPPENREQCAEIMFETFNVPGLYIGVQAVMALIASRLKHGAEKVLTGTVIDSGDGATHVIPVVDGYVIGSCMKHIPIAGSDITKFIVQTLRDRGEKQIPPHDIKRTAASLKEQFCYVAQDIVKEYEKYDKDASKFVVFESLDSRCKKPFKVDVGYERFLGPELFFNPEIFSEQYTTPLSTMVDDCIQSCPIDTKLRLYRNITLSGGSTMFKNFGKRLQRDIGKIVKDRSAQIQIRARKTDPNAVVNVPEVKVISHKMQRFAVWFGASMLGCVPTFHGMAHTREQYLENGPRIARSSPVFATL